MNDSRETCKTCVLFFPPVQKFTRLFFKLYVLISSQAPSIKTNDHTFSFPTKWRCKYPLTFPSPLAYISSSSSSLRSRKILNFVKGNNPFCEHVTGTFTYALQPTYDILYSLSHNNSFFLFMFFIMETR